VHKANIMKKADGLFLECCREVRLSKGGQVHGRQSNCVSLAKAPPPFWEVQGISNSRGAVPSMHQMAGMRTVDTAPVVWLCGFGAAAPGTQVHDTGSPL